MVFTPSPLAADPGLQMVIQALLTGVSGLLRDRLVGLYLWGSLANGGFDESSDIDFVVVLNRDITEDDIAPMHELHTSLLAIPSPWGAHLDGSYVTADVLRNYDASHPPHIYVDHGTAEPIRSQHDNTYLARHVLRERGITVDGPPPGELIDPVDSADLKAEAVAMIRGWLQPYLVDAAPLNDFYQQSYIVLALCRLLYTAEYGEVASKHVAAAWALSALGKPWDSVILKAHEARPFAFQRRHQPAEPDALAGTVELIRHAAERVRDRPASDWTDRD